nr:EOG090X07LH [Sida crystallina]
MELHCAVQKYAWGKLGCSSLVARLSQADPGAVVDEKEPYAELWMGTHPSGPAKIANSEKQLLEFLKSNPESLGEKEREVFGGDLPFLFKALSVAKALSIQAHPEKKHAEQLFQSRPDLYKDPNHKPEMVTAWAGPFEALCGFRPIAEIKSFVQDIEELADVIGPDSCQKLSAAGSEAEEKEALKCCFSSLMKCSDEQVAWALRKYERRIATMDATEQEKLLCQLFVRIAADFPGDVGCWAIYLMNYVVLQPGESMFLGPNVPHAYIYGDCLECMACSDNVVRAGLTPKFKDIETLCSMLLYEPGSVDRFRMQWSSVDERCEECRPPVADFAMARLRLAPRTTAYGLPVRSSASILLILQGHVRIDDVGQLGYGQILFLKANEQLTLSAQSDKDVVIYQAFSNV